MPIGLTITTINRHLGTALLRSSKTTSRSSFNYATSASIRLIMTSVAPQTAAATAHTQPNGTSSPSGHPSKASGSSAAGLKQSDKLKAGGADKLDVWTIFT